MPSMRPFDLFLVGLMLLGGILLDRDRLRVPAQQ
jgi:hypothetical protein